MSSKLIVDFKEIKVLLDDIFWELTVRNRLIDALKDFKNKEGYDIGGKAILFRDDLDEYDLAHLPKTLDDRHVLIDVDAATSSVNEDSQGYLSFEEFYVYLEKRVEKVISSQPDEKEELTELLLEVKKGLEV
ncbi:hypothetical protein QUF88_12975 [Bacillus sp. DX1.1]|uniref:hypothetical protein n=1 Tax=unclassified Bacillus (in: firmicutes) TaxID=185979 RepID=UPI00256FF8C9|nr:MULTISPECIES: hypothetical protein [unclassified Bacillus (in: firmicutes)]MDM5154710.1 hypothetical protein [Bacillus sp. DX1.1]WJE83598.1 hypothetical protein QRE67_10470 [Bacillus sp. DX3.1]